VRYKRQSLLRQTLGPAAAKRPSSLKVAICFFGITRNFSRHANNSLDEMLLAPVAKLDPSHKRYGHFNIVDAVNNTRSREDNVPVDRSEHRSLHCEIIEETVQEDLDRDPHFQETFAKLKQYGDSWNNDFGSLRNCLRQLHSLDCVTNVLEKSRQRFDVVIYTRVDLHFTARLAIPRIRAGTLYTPWFDKYRGLNDRFAMGDRSTMLKYGRRNALAVRYCKETGRPFHAERFLWWCAQQHRLRTVDLTSFEFCRVRAHGGMVCPATNPGARLHYRLKKILSPFRNLG